MALQIHFIFKLYSCYLLIWGGTLHLCFLLALSFQVLFFGNTHWVRPQLVYTVDKNVFGEFLKLMDNKSADYFSSFLKRYSTLFLIVKDIALPHVL